MSEFFDDQVISELKEIMGEDIGMLLETFIDDSQEKVEALADSVNSQDSDDIRRTAHSLKGSSKNVGAIALALLCEEMEHKARENILAPLPELMEKIRQAFLKTKDEIHNQF